VVGLEQYKLRVEPIQSQSSEQPPA
jgi:hypothetical protein